VKQENCLVFVRLSNRYYSVMGESAAARYPMATEQLTIFQALAQSKDILPYGNRAQVRIIRNTPQGTQIKTFDLRSEEIINSEFYYVQPNDVIYIQPLGRQFWGIDSFQSIFGLVSTVASLGIVIFYFVQK
jgi:polysaccharide export outer membrane protein